MAIDNTSPTSPVGVAPPLRSPPQPTRPRDQRPRSPPRPRMRLSTPSLTSMFACSSNDIPTTPLTSKDDDDDEWPSLSLSPSPQLCKAPTVQRVQIHPFVISKTTPHNASSATAFEFTLADPGGERTDEDEMSSERACHDAHLHAPPAHALAHAQVARSGAVQNVHQRRRDAHRVCGAALGIGLVVRGAGRPARNCIFLCLGNVLR